jgi:hypothetical protein
VLGSFWDECHLSRERYGNIGIFGSVLYKTMNILLSFHLYNWEDFECPVWKLMDIGEETHNYEKHWVHLDSSFKLKVKSQMQSTCK